MLGEWRYSSIHSLTSALDGGEWTTSCPGQFTARERVPGTHWIGGWVGPGAVLDAVVKRKIPSPLMKYYTVFGFTFELLQMIWKFTVSAQNLIYKILSSSVVSSPLAW
jgi:hypothetical protein